MDIDLNSCQFLEGTNSANMMRGLSYRTIVIPEIDKTIMVCDAEANRTFVIFDSEKPERYYKLRKSQLQHIVAGGLATDLIWRDSEEWKMKLAELLSIPPLKKRK